MQYGRIGVREIGAASIRLKYTQRRGSTGRRGLGVEHAAGCIGSRRSLARWNGQAMKSATIVGSPTVTSPGARSLGGQVLAPRDRRDRGGTGARGVRVDALREDRDARCGFGGSRRLRLLSQTRTNPAIAIRVTATSPGMTAMWFMVVFSDFSRRLARIPCCVATRGSGEIPSKPHDPGSAARGAPGYCLRVPGPEDEPGRRDAGPDEDHPVGPDDNRQGHRKISIDVLKAQYTRERNSGCPAVVRWVSPHRAHPRLAQGSLVARPERVRGRTRTRRSTRHYPPVSAYR